MWWAKRRCASSTIVPTLTKLEFYLCQVNSSPVLVQSRHARIGRPRVPPSSPSPPQRPNGGGFSSSDGGIHGDDILIWIPPLVGADEWRQVLLCLVAAVQWWSEEAALPVWGSLGPRPEAIFLFLFSAGGGTLWRRSWLWLCIAGTHGEATLGLAVVVFLRRKWLTRFTAVLADLFPSSSPSYESGDIVVSENRADFGFGGRWRHPTLLP
jgi:hypothetical protein